MSVGLSSFAAVLGQMPDRVGTLAVASKLASVGVPVFPVWADSKRPITRHGFHDASTDAEQIGAWWSSVPSASLAIPTGRASGVVVVDVDVHGRVNGYEAAARAKHAGLLSGWELMARTPSGGMHLYFPVTDAVEQRSWQSAGAGIDFQKELARRARAAATGRIHELGDRARRLPPLSAFGRRGTDRGTERGAVGRR